MFSDSPDLTFRTVFEQSELNFRDCFRTIRAGFSGFFSGSPGLIFGLCVCFFFFFFLCAIAKF